MKVLNARTREEDEENDKDERYKQPRDMTKTGWESL